MKEKLEPSGGASLRTLPNGFKLRRNHVDTGVLISMPFEYGILEYNFKGIAVNVVDAGANIGAFALYISQVSKVTQYFGVEASPDNYRLLKTNLAVLGPQFQSMQAAVTDSRRELTFDFGGVPSQLKQTATGSVVMGLPLDEIPEVASMNVIDILKMDIEGGETDAIAGAENTLKKTRFVIMEVHHDDLGEEQLARLFELMDRDFDHIFFRLSPTGLDSNCLFYRRTPL